MQEIMQAKKLSLTRKLEDGYKIVADVEEQIRQLGIKRDKMWIEMHRITGALQFIEDVENEVAKREIQAKAKEVSLEEKTAEIKGPLPVFNIAKQEFEPPSLEGPTYVACVVERAKEELGEIPPTKEEKQAIEDMKNEIEKQDENREAAQTWDDDK